MIICALPYAVKAAGLTFLLLPFGYKRPGPRSKFQFLKLHAMSRKPLYIPYGAGTDNQCYLNLTIVHLVLE